MAAEDFVAVSCTVYDDWNREVIVHAHSHGFSGRASAYFGVDRLTTFAAALGRYPLDDERPQLSSGFGVHSGTFGGDGITQEHVGITVEQIGLTGQIGMAVHLATPDWGDARPAEVHDVRLEVLTTYERLGGFGLDVIEVVGGRLDRAVILGEQLR